MSLKKLKALGGDLNWVKIINLKFLLPVPIRLREYPIFPTKFFQMGPSVLQLLTMQPPVSLTRPIDLLSVFLPLFPGLILPILQGKEL